MILTTPTKHSYTTTGHNNNGYIFTLYLFMLLCVGWNCLLFYCSCTGNCENCCGINGNANVSGSSTSWSEIKIDIKNKQKNEIKSENDEYVNESMIEFGNKDIIENNKNNSEINDIKNNSEIWNKNQQNKMDKNDKLKDFTISADGKIDGIQIVNQRFAKLVKAYKYNGNSEEEYKKSENEFIKGINIESGTHLFAYVEVKNNDIVQLQCFIHCTDANSINEDSNVYGLFQGSKATGIEILSCGSEIKNMNSMFLECSSLTNLDLYSFNTNKVTNMGYMFAYCRSLTALNLSNFNTSNVKDMSCMFSYCSSLTNINLSKFNTNNVTDMSYMFNWCSSLTELDLSKFNTTNVTNMSCMFSDCSKLTVLYLSSFNTKNVKNMELYLSSFNTKNVKNMEGMFYKCSSLTALDLSKFNTNNVTNMSNMFAYCSSLKELDLSKFNTNNVTDMGFMFYFCSDLMILKLGINFHIPNKSGQIFHSSFSQNNVEIICQGILIQYFLNNKIFSVKEKLVLPEKQEELISLYKFFIRGSKIYYYEEYISTDNTIQYDNKLKDGKIEGIQIVNTKYTTSSFQLCVNRDACKLASENMLHKYNTKKYILASVIVNVKRENENEMSNNNGNNFEEYFIFCKSDNDDCFSSLFSGSEAIKIEIIACGSEIKNINGMFAACHNLRVVILGPLTELYVTDMSNMFNGCSKLTNINLSNFKTSAVVNMSYMFSDCSSLINIIFPDNFNTNNVINMQAMFYNCSSLTILDLSNFNTTKVTDMGFMFYNCSSLTILDLSNFNTTKVTNMSWMFYNCRSLTNLDLSSFNTNTVKYMSYMFYNCYKLTKLNLFNWDTSSAIEMRSMLYKCFSLENEASLILSDNMFDKIISGINIIGLKIETELKNAYINKNVTRQNLLTINNGTIISRRDYKYVITVYRNTQNNLIAINYGANNSDNILLFKTDDKDLVCEKFTVYYISEDNNPDDVSKIKKLKNKILIYKDVLEVRGIINCIEKKGINAENKYIEENFEENFIDTYIFAVVKKDNIQYFIYADNINSIKEGIYIYGLFKGSKATEIEILSCGNNIKNMSSMFDYCSSLTSIKFPDSFTTNNVTDMSFMFNNCSSLKELDLSSFNTQNVTDMSNMFAWCTNLMILKLGINFKIIFDKKKDIVLSIDTQGDIQIPNISLKKTFGDMFNNCFQNNAKLICNVDFIRAHISFCKSVGKNDNMLVIEGNVVLPQKNNLLYLFVLNANTGIVDWKEYKEYDKYAK